MPGGGHAHLTPEFSPQLTFGPGARLFCSYENFNRAETGSVWPLHIIKG